MHVNWALSDVRLHVRLTNHFCKLLINQATLSLANFQTEITVKLLDMQHYTMVVPHEFNNEQSKLKTTCMRIVE